MSILNNNGKQRKHHTQLVNLVHILTDTTFRFGYLLIIFALIIIHVILSDITKDDIAFLKEQMGYLNEKHDRIVTKLSAENNILKKKIAELENTRQDSLPN